MIAVIVRLYCIMRFGRVTSMIRSIDGGVVSEEEYYDRRGVTIGYFAYGHMNPNLPFGYLCLKYAAYSRIKRS